MKPCHRSRVSLAAQVNLIVLLLILSSAAQERKPPDNDVNSVGASLNELRSEVRELKDLVQQLKQETTASRAEITKLRHELELERAGPSTASVPGGEQTSQVDVRIGHLEEEQQLLTGKIDDQYQTKVESASKYRVRFSGMALFNLFSNQGSVDNMDVPTLAHQYSGLTSSGSFGATLRQSIFGFEVFGPQLLAFGNVIYRPPAVLVGVSSFEGVFHLRLQRLGWAG